MEGIVWGDMKKIIKANKKRGEFKENLTKSVIGEKEYTYFEKALDRNGKWLKIGDWVRVVGNTENQTDLRGGRRKIIGIFEKDLLLETERGYDYCWPINVIKTK